MAMEPRVRELPGPSIQVVTMFPGGFTIQNIVPGDGGRPDIDNCQIAFDAISAQCITGGSAEFNGDGFLAALDPNTGSCGIPGSN